MSKLSYFIIFLVVIFAIVASSSCNKESKCDCSADTIKIAKIFQPNAALGKDAVIESITPDNNSANTPLFGIFTWTNNGLFNTARSLIEFDFSSIPAQTKIKSAKLSLYWSAYQNLTEQTGENYFSIYRITQEWDENTVTWNNQPSITDLNKVAVPKSTLVDQSYTIDVTQLVQDMINNPLESHGFMFKLNEEFPYRLVVLASSDATDNNLHPKLTVIY